MQRRRRGRLPEGRHPLVAAGFGFVLGAVIGSFVGVVADRALGGGSVAGGHAARSPLVEAGLGLAFAGAVLVLHDDPTQLVLGLVLLTTLAVVTQTDLEQRLIPNSILIVAAVVGVAIAATDPPELGQRAIAAAAAGGFFLVAALAFPRGMGMGDVKLAALIGFYVGAAAAPAVLIALFGGAVVGVAIIARQGAAGRKQAVPFGPFLAFGGLVGLLAGNEILGWYLDSFIHS